MPESGLRIHPAALAEAERARDWYRTREPSASAAFLRELDQAIRRIMDSPTTWPIFIQGTRRYLLPSFPFSIVYRVHDCRIEVLAVAHDRRRPGYWADRSSDSA